MGHYALGWARCSADGDGQAEVNSDDDMNSQTANQPSHPPRFFALEIQNNNRFYFYLRKDKAVIVIIYVKDNYNEKRCV